MTASTAIPLKSSRPAGLVSLDGRAYPLKSAAISARAEGGVAATTFTQTYGNPYDEPLEVLYTMPLPAEGAVIGYTIRLGSRAIRGEVHRRAEAREKYRKALLEGRTAALLEQDRAGTFTQKLGCLPPKETADVEIEVIQPLSFLPADSDGPARWEYRFPTVVGVRYQGADGRVPDADRIDIDRVPDGTPAMLEARLVIADGPVDQVHPHAPHFALVCEPGDNGAIVSLRERARLDRDLVIRWSAGSAGVGVRLVEGKGLSCDDGRYALITLTPPSALDCSFARDLTLLIDASGSMSGQPLEQAKIVAKELLRSLSRNDRFEVLAFAGKVQQLVRGPAQADEENIACALRALDSLSAGGCTEMTQAMVEALRPLRPDSQRQVVLISDGQIGFEAEVIGEVMRSLVARARLHTVGIGSAPNRALTRGAARAGRGIEILVGDDSDARAAARRLLHATVGPILTDIEIGGSAVISAAPQRACDVMENQPQVFLAELAAHGGLVEIAGNLAGAPRSWIRSLEVPDTASRGSLPSTSVPLGALFGKERIEDIELEITVASGRDEAAALEQKIETLGLRHGIASRKTSLAAISEDLTVDPTSPRRRERLPVEVPAEVSVEGSGLVMAMQAFPNISASRAMISDADESGIYKAEADYDIESSSMDLRRLDFSLISGPPELRPRIKGVRILLREDDILVIEFEVPSNGFRLPAEKTSVQVRFDDGTVRSARIDAKDSSPEGPHNAGLTVRLKLILTDAPSPTSKPLSITWPQKRNGWIRRKAAPSVELIISQDDEA